jgi:hypothetical protein
MDITDLLMLDHRALEKQFSELITSTPTQRKSLFETLYADLVLHTTIEEKFFYSALLREAPDQVSNAMKEHRDATRKLDLLRTMDIDSDGFVDQLAIVMKDVQIHIREEEEPHGLLAIARRQFARAMLQRVGEQAEQFKSARKGPVAA